MADKLKKAQELLAERMAGEIDFNAAWTSRLLPDVLLFVEYGADQWLSGKIPGVKTKASLHRHMMAVVEELWPVQDVRQIWPNVSTFSRWLTARKESAEKQQQQKPSLPQNSSRSNRRPRKTV